MAEAYPTFLAGQRITASLLSSAQAQIVRKTADTARTATTSRTADPHLAFTAVASAVYIFDGFLKMDGDTAGDISLQVTVPSGALGEILAWGAGNNVIGSNATPTLQSNTGDPRGYMVRTETLDINAARTFGLLGAGGSMGMVINGTVRMSTTPGTVSLDWAQAVSSATATTLFTDSWLRFQRIA